jgi:hypothetical protein
MEQGESPPLKVPIKVAPSEAGPNFMALMVSIMITMHAWW